MADVNSLTALYSQSRALQEHYGNLNNFLKKYGLASEPTPPEPGVMDRVGVGAKALGLGLWDAAMNQLPATVARVYRAGDVGDPRAGASGLVNSFIDEQTKDTQGVQGRLSPQERDQEVVPGFTVPFTDFKVPSITGKDILSGVGNLGYSAPSMIAGLGAGALAAESGPGAIAAASATAGAVGGVIGYRATKDQFVQEATEHFLKQRPKASKQDVLTFQKSIEPLATEYGLWEAGPEAVSQAVTAGLIKLPVADMLSKVFPALKAAGPAMKANIMGKVASGVIKTGADLGEELTTETVTQKNQGRIESEVGMRDKAPTWGESFQEVYPQVVPMVGVTMGAGGLHNMALERARARRQAADDAPRPEATDLAREATSGIDSVVSELKGEQVPQAPPAPFQGVDAHDPAWNLRRIDLSARHVPGQPTVSDYFNPATEQALARLRDAPTDQAPFAPVGEGVPLWDVRRITPENGDLSSLVAPSPLDQALEKIRAMNAAQERDRFNANLPATDHERALAPVEEASTHDPSGLAQLQLPSAPARQGLPYGGQVVSDNARRDLPVPSAALPSEGSVDVGEMPPSERLAPSLPGVDRLQALADAAKTTPRVAEEPQSSPVAVRPESPPAADGLDGLIMDKSGKPFKDKTINLAVAQSIKRGRNVEAVQIGPNRWGMRLVEDAGPNTGTKYERASIETELAAVQAQGYDAMRDRAEELIDSGKDVDVVYDVLAGMEERATPKSEVGPARWDIFPVIDDKGTRHVGDISQSTADEINRLGFKTKPSRAVLLQENVDYIEKQHGDQLKPKDVELLREAVSNPSEVLPNIPTQTGPGRANRVLLVKQNGKAHVAIVEMSADESDNTVFNFWKMDKKTAEAYLKKYREEKVKRQSNLGGRPNVPSIAPTSSAEDGSPVGLSGGQVDAASEKEITTSNPEGKDDTPEKLDLTLGEKIGGSRKDTAEATGPHVRIPGRDGEGKTWWQKRFTVARTTEVNTRTGESNSFWGISDAKGKLRLHGQAFRFDTKEEAEAAIPLAAVSLKHRVVKNKDAWGIDRKITDRKHVTIKDGFATEDEAKRYMTTHAEEILDTKTGYGEEILAKPEKVMREGIPRREGPASGQDFLDTFGFRGVEFGKWNDQLERQEVLNHAYDGLLDLADILNVPARALSLDGDLALAFGARGRGLSSAKAHYERDYAVINLTKMTGAGSLAHEWFHALDHYLARQDGKASSEKVANERGDMVLKAKTPLYDFQSHGESLRSSKMREELRKAYKNLMHAMTHKAEQFKEDTEKAERFVGRARGYLEKELQNIRAGLVREIQWGKKKAPATDEQLAKFDALVDQLLSGDNLTLEMRDNDAGGKRRSRFGSYRNSNDVIDGLASIYKEVRGRNGFNAEKSGPFNALTAYVQDFARRAKMLADARAETEKTKQVPTQFRQDAHAMDRGRTTDYWSEPHELAARAFSAYVEDKAQGNGGRSDFLVYGANNDMPAYKLFNARPFPEGTEREAINAAFDKFFQTVKTKETEHGVMMYQRQAEAHEKAGPAVTLKEAQVLLERSGLSSLAEAYESLEMMPKAVQDVLHATNGEEEPAFFHGGKLYFNLAHTQDRADLARSIAHEIIHPGEGAFARKLGLRMGVREAQISLNNIKDRIFHDYRKEIQTLLTEYGYNQDYDIRTLEGRRGIVGELLATRSETFAPRWYDKVAALVARIVNGVRAKMGLGPMRFTEAEMRELIGGIRSAFAEEQGGMVAGAGEMAPAFQRVSPDATDKHHVALEYGRRVVEATKAWNKVVDDAVSGKANPRAILRIGETPDMLVGFGLPRLPMVMDKSTLDKITGVKPKKGSLHYLTNEQVKNLYHHLADPVAFVREAARSAVVLTEMDEGGKSVLVPIQVNATEGRIQVNAVPSAYGQENISRWLKRFAADGKLVYLDKKRAATLKDMSGPLLAGVLQARLQSGKKLLTEGDVVKPVFQEPGEQPLFRRAAVAQEARDKYGIAFDPQRKALTKDSAKAVGLDLYAKIVNQHEPLLDMAGQAGPEARRRMEIATATSLRGAGSKAEALIDKFAPIVSQLKSDKEWVDYEAIRKFKRQVALAKARPEVKREDYLANMRHLRTMLGQAEGREDKRSVRAAMEATRQEYNRQVRGLDVKRDLAHLEEIKQRIGAAEFIRMETISAEHRAFEQTHVLDALHDAGILSDERWAAIRQASDTEMYSALQREMDEKESHVLGTREVIKRLKGSDRMTIPSIEATIANLDRTVRLIEKNKVARLLTHDIRDLTPDLQQILQPVKVGGERFAPADAITVFVGGKKQYFKVPEDIRRALDGTSHEEMHIVMKMLSLPAKLLRAGATLSPEFVARNPIRDQFTAFLFSKYGYIPFWDMGKGFASLWKKDDMYRQWREDGGDNAFLVALDRDSKHKQARELIGLPNDWEKKVKHYVGSPIQFLQAISGFTEKGTRLGAYKRALAKGASREEAALESREITLDFARMGYQGKAINQITAFWNANVQDIDKLQRTLRERPGQTLLRMTLGIFLPSFLLWQASHDDDGYQQLPIWQRNAFWNFKIPGGKEFFSIPKPFLPGAVFGTFLGEALPEVIARGDTKFAKESAANIASNLFALPFPTASKPVLEWWSNYSFFRSAPIENQSMQRLPAGMRTRTGTSDVISGIGRLTGISPLKLENTWRGLAGGLGRMGTDLADTILKKVAGSDVAEPAKRWWEVAPVVKGFVRPEPIGSAGRALDDFFDNLEDARQAKGGYKVLTKSGDADGAKKYLVENRNRIVMASVFETASRDLSKLREAISAVRRNKTMDAEAKRAKIDDLNRRATRLAIRANKMWDKRVEGGL